MQSQPSIHTKIQIRLFAAAADVVGESSLSVALLPGDSLADVAKRVCIAYPELEPLLAVSRWAINQEFASLLERVSLADELAIIPPVSGG